MSELFALPIETLRENFVRARFAERDNFNNGDIVNWLADQSIAERPDVPAWQSLFKCRVLYVGVDPREAARVLKAGGFRYIDCTNGYLEDLPDHSHTKRLRPLLYSLTRLESAKDCVYVNLVDHPIVVVNPSSEFFAYDLVETYTNLMPDRVYGSLLMSWKTCSVQNRQQLLRMQSAQAELVHFVDAAIRKTRQSAEADFERAVAVSEDGADIVCADSVYVWSESSGVPVGISTVSCQNDKILLTPTGRSRLVVNENEQPRPTKESILRRTMENLFRNRWYTDQSFFRLDGEAVFMTHVSRVPASIRTAYRL